MKNFTEHGDVQELESPFLHLTSFKQHLSQPVTKTNIIPASSPFKSVYELEGEEQGYDEENEAFVELMDELYDEEFDDILEEIANEARDLYENQLTQNYNGLQNQEVRIRQTLDEHFSPFINEVERFIDHMVHVADQYDTENMTDDEWEHLVDQYVPQMETSPTFEDFGGWLKKKWKKVKKKVKKVARAARKVVKKGMSIAKKFGFGWVFRKLGRYVIKFLKGFLKKGIHKLSPKNRSLAKKLAEKIGIHTEINEYENDEIEFQQELDSMLAEFLIAPNETELEIIEQEFLNETDTIEEDPLDLLDTAREAFVQQISQLQEGENPEPAIEEFVATILMGLKWGIRIIGKKRVKNFFVNRLTALARKYMDKKYARMLSKHIVNAGFKMLNLELTPEQEVEEGSRAIAAVLEDTVRQIAQLPEHVLQNETLLESNIVQAFEESAKTNFPDILSEEMYTKRPDLRETSKHRVAWKMKTIKKGRRKKCRYKKLNKEIETELTPYLAQEIKTYGGIPLGNMLRDQMGIIVNRSIPVKVHLYETLPGANRYQIGKNETGISGLGTTNNNSWQNIHPLTSVAAGLLMGEPALGCKSITKCLAHKNSVSAHRYYYLEIPGARPQMYSAPSGVQYLRKISGLKVKLNFVKNQIQLFLFLGETDAQNIATQVRQQMESNAARLSTMAMQEGLKIAFSRHSTEHINVLHPNVIPGKMSGLAMNYVPVVIQNQLKSKLNGWVASRLSEYFMNSANELVRAADSDADGVTICITMEAPKDFNVMGQLINFKKVQIPEHIFSENALEMNIEVKPGYHYV